MPGIHIQWPWSRLLADGIKTVETRGYQIPVRYIAQEIAIIETPGRLGPSNGVSEASIIGTIIFGKSFEYSSQDAWVEDFARHRVPPDDVNFSWKSGTKKWGWPVTKVRKLTKPKPAPKVRGIVFTKRCVL